MSHKRIFISHRHDDANIAKAIKNTLEDWGIARDEIFLSSDARTSGGLGQTIRNSLKEAAATVKLLLLVYTSENDDWSWCTWECGLVEDPMTPRSNIVVLQCGSSPPKVYEDCLRVVGSNRETIEAFADQFHTKSDFFPGEPAFRPNSDDSLIKRRAIELERALMYNDREERRVYRWSHLLFFADADLVAKMREVTASSELNTEFFWEIAEKLKVTGAGGIALEHFGFAKDAEGKTLKDLADAWREATGENETKWINKLCAELWRGVHQYVPKLKLTPMLSAYEDGKYHVLLINNELTFLRCGSMEFLVNTYKTRADES